LQQHAGFGFCVECQASGSDLDKACEQLTGLKAENMIGSRPALARPFYTEKRPMSGGFTAGQHAGQR